MPKVREELKPVPPPMIGRPVDHRGFPVPWFVTQQDSEGLWDFVNIEGARFIQAHRSQLCWVSGTPLGKFRSYVVGPMCVVNRVSADPPVIPSVAVWSARVCPFLSRPRAKRAEVGEDVRKAQRGIMLERNPGVCAIYTVKGKSSITQGLFNLQDPERVEWFCEGRPATREEVQASMDEGLPALWGMAKAESKEAEIALDAYIKRAEALLP